MKNLSKSAKLVYLSPAIVFLIIAIGIKTGILIQFDSWITKAIYNEISTPIGMVLFQVISNYTLGSIFGILAISVFLLYKKKFDWLIYFLGTGLFLYIIEHIIKSLFHRLRPFLAVSDISSLPIKVLTDYSFPSGHSMLAFFIAYFAVNKFKPHIAIKTFIYWLAFMVALSRIALGVHYLLDTVAGACLGTILAYLAVYLSNKFEPLSQQIINKIKINRNV